MAGRPKAPLAEQIERLSRGDWIAAALQALTEGGVANVRVEVLAKTLKVTKGSFYWHFTDRNDLLVAMLEHWRMSLGSDIADMIKRKESAPDARLRYLLKLSTAKRDDVPGGPTEQAIREWAKTSDLPRVALSQLESDRLEILTGLYSDLGCEPRAARARAVLFLSFVIGLNVLSRDLVGVDLGAERDLCIPTLATLDMID